MSAARCIIRLLVLASGVKPGEKTGTRGADAPQYRPLRVYLAFLSVSPFGERKWGGIELILGLPPGYDIVEIRHRSTRTFIILY